MEDPSTSLEKLSIRADDSSCEIRFLNYSDEETIDYPFVLLECQIIEKENASVKEAIKTTHHVSGSDQPVLESLHEGSAMIETQTDCRTWPIAHGGFKALVQLSTGENVVKIKALSCGKCIERELNLIYKPSTLPRFVRIVYVKCNDSDGSFEAPSGVANNVEIAKKKLAFNARLLQTFTAQDLYQHGLGHRTFRLEEDCNGEPLIHVFTSELTTEEALKMTGGELYETFSAELSKSHLDDPLCKFVTFMSCTHYDPPPAEEFNDRDIHSYVKAHTALGGGNLALFGTGGLHTWASDVDELIGCFTNTKMIDRRCLFDDSCHRGMFWANYATGLGASMHELGHCFDLAHTPQGIMGRGFDDFNCVFSLWKHPPPSHVDNENGSSTEENHNHEKEDDKGVPVSVAPLSDQAKNLAKPGDWSHGAKWYRSSAVILRYHKWFSDIDDSEDEFSKDPVVHWGRTFFGPVGNMSDQYIVNKTKFNDKTWLSANKVTFGGCVVHAGVYVNCLQTIGRSVATQDGVETVKELLSEPQGRIGVGQRYVFRLDEPDEHVVAFDVRAGAWIDALRIHTNYKSSVWMGGKGGSVNYFKPPEGEKIVGLFGTAGDFVGSLGIFLESSESAECSPCIPEPAPQVDEDLIVEAPNGLRLIELQNKKHGEVYKHWEFLDPSPPTRFLLNRNDIVQQEASIMIVDDSGNIHRSGPFYDLDKFFAGDEEHEEKPEEDLPLCQDSQVPNGQEI